MNPSPIQSATRGIHDGLALRALLLGVLACCCLGAGCERDGATRERRAGEPELTALRYLGSHGQVSMPELAEDLGYLAPLTLAWAGSVLGGPESIQAVGIGDVHFGAAATGSVLKLIAAGAPLKQVIASNGVDDRTYAGYYVADDSPVREARDLLGKKVAVNTLGAHAEFMIREWLRRGGLGRDEIQQVSLVVTPPSNGEQTLRAGQVEMAALGGVFRDRAVQRGGLRRVFSDRELFGSFNTATYVFHERFLAQHPNVVRKFVEGTARAIEWARSQPVEVVRARMRALYAKRGRGEDPTLAQHWHSVGIRSPGGLLSDADITLWVDWLVREGDLKPAQREKLVGSYTTEFHPFRGTTTAAARVD